MTKRQKQIAEERYNNLFFTVKGVKFKQTGIRKNSNGSWTVSVKNCETGKFKDVGYYDLQKILKNSYNA